MTSRTYEDYTVGWICAIKIEETAAKAMLDDLHEPLPQRRNDSNVYILGRIGKHNIVIACLPAGKLGTPSAAITATNMFRTFTELRFCLMVGVGGGLPTDGPGVRLGDVVVSVPRPKQNAVVSRDFGKIDDDGFVRTHSLNAPPRILLNAVNRVQTEHSEGKKGYLRHMASVPEPIRSTLSIGDAGSTKPSIFYGTISTGNQLIANATVRDSLRDDSEALCIEMEARGLMDDFQCLVVRGICDYSDSRKRKEWQGPAALAAAAYGKELLSFIEPEAAAVVAKSSIQTAMSTITLSNSSAAVSKSVMQSSREEFATLPTPSSPQPRDSFFVVNRHISESNTVALGRLVVNIRAPWEDYCPYTKAPDEKDIGISLEPQVQGIIEATRGLPVHERFVTMLSRLFGDEDVIRAINSVSCTEKLYILPNSSVRFEELCKDTRVREWFSTVIRYGIDTYMIVGLHTLSTPATCRMKGSSQVASDFASDAAGEVIIGIQYRKVRYHWFWFSGVDKAFLECSNVWEPIIITKCPTAEDREIVQATLEDNITTSDFKDEGEVITIRGQVILF
jgi:nucleoside phosphorylase